MKNNIQTNMNLVDDDEIEWDTSSHDNERELDTTSHNYVIEIENGSNNEAEIDNFSYQTNIPLIKGNYYKFNYDGIERIVLYDKQDAEGLHFIKEFKDMPWFTIPIVIPPNKIKDVKFALSIKPIEQVIPLAYQYLAKEKSDNKKRPVCH